MNFSLSYPARFFNFAGFIFIKKQQITVFRKMY